LRGLPHIQQLQDAGVLAWRPMSFLLGWESQAGILAFLMRAMCARRIALVLVVAFSMIAPYKR